MSLNSESIIGLVALLVTSPPAVYWLYKLATRPRARRETYLPLHRDEHQDIPQHHPPTVYLQRHETWSSYTNIVINPADAHRRSMTIGEAMTAAQEI
ncbi:hypothetical protein P171DRAFT_518305 [Karstenula rhodostoma CBS 690.94]|uniref:Uncharacterized protein n=1 Tax=Karstenula rhodostoma CBS 690.94 TaxID=1392251 RepID=A0A9P4PRJ3_9PLEO|nr:hypothetical protein P171DRAFT_518305 [Karstenula rhodostoma CBS 690.94]